MKKNRFLSLLAGVALALTGCAYMHSTTRSFDATGKLTGKTTATAYALLDSNAQLTKFRNQSATSSLTNGSTFSPGTYIASVNENATSTNIVAILQAVSALISAVPK